MDKWFRRQHILWIALVILDIILVQMVQSTYDSGDSILHYLQAKQAIHYPLYYLNHWAKPVFVLLSSGFAAFGWNGMQLFNTLCILGSTAICYRLFSAYQLKSWTAIVLCFAAPLYFLVQSSGLTEPLFTLFLVSIIYLFKKEKTVLAVILLSFLPFIRSEGWVVAPIFMLYLAQIKQWKAMPFVVVGTIIYGIAGYFVYSDFLWMFHQNPYQGVEPKYGSGDWLHYVNQLQYVIGFPLFTFFLLGIYDGFWRSLKGNISWHEFYLVYGITIGYIAAHSIFWAEGLFHSFGLNRVLIVLIPLIAFIAYRGIERIACAFSFIMPKYVWYSLVGIAIVFPFTENKAGLNLPESVQQEPLQSMIDGVRHYTDSAYGNKTIYYGNTYIPMSYNLDIDNPDEALKIGLLLDYAAEPESLVLWDSYFAPSDQNVSEGFIQHKDGLKFIKRFNCVECRKSYYIDLYEAESK